MEAFLALAVPMKPPPLRFSADDIRRVKAAYGVTCGFCGPVALAAISGEPLDTIMRFATNGKITAAEMRYALFRLCLPLHGCGQTAPKHGLMVIDFNGPPTHWVCVSGGKLLDNHTVLAGRDWVSAREWSRLVQPKTNVTIREAIEVG